MCLRNGHFMLVLYNLDLVKALPMVEVTNMYILKFQVS